ncbi:MAG: hypothetical protein LBJ77_00830 [Holosporales bacterium]|nr:hypothetical protein [Holosporales bacterium]
MGFGEEPPTSSFAGKAIIPISKRCAIEVRVGQQYGRTGISAAVIPYPWPEDISVTLSNAYVLFLECVANMPPPHQRRQIQSSQDY